MAVAFVTLLVLIVLGLPIAFVLGLTATATTLVLKDVPLNVIAHHFFGGMNGFTIMAIPFFVLAGVIMEHGGLSRRIVDFASALVGWITGSLLMVSVSAATALAAMSGSGSADAVAVSSVMTPELRKRRYDIDFSSAVIAAAGCLAQIIPPSIMMVLIAVANDISIGALFLAGIIPGLLVVPGFFLICYIHARRGGPQYREVQPFSLARLGSTFLVATPSLGMAVVITGGILGGVFTPTEAACVSVFYGLFVGMVIHRDLKIADLPRVFLRATSLSCGILLLIGTGTVFTYLIATADVPQAVEGFFRAFIASPITFLLAVNAILMIACMFVETFPIILILSPVLVPIAISYGIDPVHFATVFVFNCAIGMITPPIGGVLFVVAAVARRPIAAIARRIWGPWAVMTGVLLLITFVPDLVLSLPRWAGLHR